MPKDGHVLIDVREDREWEAGHAAGALHLNAISLDGGWRAWNDAKLPVERP